MTRRNTRRRGFSLLEVQVAFVLLGIAIAGVGPLVVMQMKLARKFENGFNPQTSYFRPGTTFYLVPRPDVWERKLGIAATLSQSAGSGSSGGSSGTPAYAVSVTGVEKQLGSESVSVHVLITATSS